MIGGDCTARKWHTNVSMDTFQVEEQNRLLQHHEMSDFNVQYLTKISLTSSDVYLKLRLLE